jgi:hypothetical protein
MTSLSICLKHNASLGRRTCSDPDLQGELLHQQIEPKAAIATFGAVPRPVRHDTPPNSLGSKAIHLIRAGRCLPHSAGAIAKFCSGRDSGWLIDDSSV